MSLKIETLLKIRRKFLEESPYIKSLEEKEKKLISEIMDIIRDAQLSRAPDTFLKYFQGRFFKNKIVYFGTSFDSLYGDGNIPEGDYSGSVGYYIPVIPGILKKNQKNDCFDFEDLGVKDVLVDLNRKLIECRREINSIKYIFDHFLNQKTSLSWLKANLPGIYKECKQ